MTRASYRSCYHNCYNNNAFIAGVLAFVITFIFISPVQANKPPLPAAAPPPQAPAPMPPHLPSGSHNNIAKANFINCGISDSKEKAEQGDIKLQTDLGRCFYFKVGNDSTPFKRGINTPPPQSWSSRDAVFALEIILKSIYWLSKAAEQNNADAQFYLAKAIYLKETIQFERINKLGLIRDKINSKRNKCIANAKQSSDYPKSIIKCYSLPVYRAQRDQINTLLNWANGSVHENEFSGESASWMRSAANAGHIRAQFELAHYLIHGTGIAIDFVEAQAWRIVAANQNPVTGNKIRYWLSNMNWLTNDEEREAEIIGRRYEKEYSDLWKNPSVIIIHD